MVHGDEQVQCCGAATKSVGHEDEGCASSCNPCGSYRAGQRSYQKGPQFHPVVRDFPVCCRFSRLPPEKVRNARTFSPASLFTARAPFQETQSWSAWKRTPSRADARECLCSLVDALGCAAGEVTRRQRGGSIFALQLAVGSFGCAAAAYKMRYARKWLFYSSLTCASQILPCACQVHPSGAPCARELSPNASRELSPNALMQRRSIVTPVVQFGRSDPRWHAEWHTATVNLPDMCGASGDASVRYLRLSLNPPHRLQILLRVALAVVAMLGFFRLFGPYVPMPGPAVESCYT